MRISVFKADENKTGIWYGVFAYTLWGILPLYWKLMQAVPPLEILAHRILWSFVFMFLLTVFTGGVKTFAVGFADKKKLLLMFLCGLLVSINWFIYVFAVNTGHVIEASMGYFINPLVVVMLGVVVFKEKMTRWQLTAVILATIGVLMITIQYGRVPWISLFLAGSFATYGLVKKIIRVNSITGLTMETLVIMPAALFYIIGLEINAVGVLGSAALPSLLFLAGTGVVTIVPLLFYARGIEKTTFSMMGFLQYIAPSISLFLGIFIFKEYFSFFHLVSFCFIWAALLIFALESVGIIRDPFLIRTEKL